MWLPGQSVSDWAESVDRLIATGPDHVSLCCWSCIPNAPLKEDMARAGWSLAPDEGRSRDVSDWAGGARRRRVSAVRFRMSAATGAVSTQPEILD